MPIDAAEFLDIARPLLIRGDASQLARAVGYRWTGTQIIELLTHPDADVRRVAAVCVGLVGDRSLACRLAAALHDHDEQVVKMTEHGLWMLWFRGGTDPARQAFQDGLSLLNQQRHPESIAFFERAAAIDPHFAEAYNQCALAHEMLEQWPEAIADCRLAIKHMNCHFGAMACMGHCFAQMNDLHRALSCYREALRIHPRLAGVRSTMERLENCLGNVNDHSGRYDPASVEPL